MLTSLIVCSDDRADTLADILESCFSVYSATLDTEFSKNYDDEAPHGVWTYSRWEDSQWINEDSPPEQFDLLFVHTGANDLTGSNLAKARIAFAFSANGVGDLGAAYNLIPIRPEFPSIGDSPVTVEDVRSLAILLSGVKNVSKDDVVRQFSFCRPLAQENVQNESFIIAAELLELERQRTLRPTADGEELARASEAAALEDHESPHLYTNEQLRPKLWHVCKNVLFQFHSRRISRYLVEFTLGKMEKWEVRAYGERSAELKKITDFIKRNDREAAAELADEIYKHYIGSTSRSRMLTIGSSFHTSDANESRSRQFSILVVDDDEEFLRNSVSQLRELAVKCSEYDIEILKAGAINAFPDAISAVEQHAGIQGIIVDWDLTSRADGPALGTGIDLIKQIRQILPRVHACLLTGRGALSIAVEIADADIRPFSKSDADSLEHAFSFIVSSIRDRESTPFFSALAEYSGRQISPFHALAISGGRGVRKSPWLDSFYDFYGARVFLAETSSTQPPLDSLLSPKGSIREAEARAALVFGADRVRFVTNGTSTANKIVHQALLRPGDIVLIDRTCHKSHHYAMVLIGALPVYLGADPVSFESDFMGFTAGVRTSTILDALRSHPKAKMLCLTNCTFDGYIHDIHRIITDVLATLKDMRASGIETTAPEEFVFFFDEAWFGTALFTRELRDYSAMETARSIPSARVYATQSTHKTLIAFRQGSMILIRDPLFLSSEEYFNEAFFTHTTTSPNYSIIASLDAGRMWADLDGDRICNEAWQIALEIRRQIKRDPAIGREFAVLESGDLLSPELRSSSISVDQTKISLYIRDRRLTGRSVNAMLAEEDIQFNKYTNNTVLLIVTPGTNESGAAHLLVSLRRLATRIARQRFEFRGLRANLPFAALEAPVFFRDDFDLRRAYFGQGPIGFHKRDIRLVDLKSALQDRLESTDCLSARFVIPYPPGFPLLVPGQYVSLEIVQYLLDLDTKEIHGMPIRDTLGVWMKEDLPGT